MRKPSFLILLFLMVVGCFEKTDIPDVHFPQNTLLSNNLPQFLIGYCWQIPDGRISKNNPQDKEVSIAVSEVSAQYSMIIRDAYNLPPNQTSDFFIYKSGCVEYGDNVRYKGNAISIDPSTNTISFVSGSDPNLTRYSFYKIDQETHTINEVSISNIKSHNNYFFNPKNLSWSSDGSKMAILGMDTGSGSGNIWVYNLSEKTFHKVTNFTGIKTLAANASWSKNGDKLAIGLGEVSGVQIYDYSQNDDAKLLIEISHNTHPNIIGEWPYVGRNLILLTIKNQNLRFNKYVFTTSKPVWISDNEVVFAAANPNGLSSLYRLNIDFGITQLLIEDLGGNVFMPTVSPNGELLSFVRYHDWNNKNKVEVGIISLEELKVNSLVVLESKSRDDAILISGMDWSPDGNYLAFSSNHNGESDIYIISVDGQYWTNVTSEVDGNAVSPFWVSP